MRKTLLIGATLLLLIAPTIIPTANASTHQNNNPKGIFNWGFIIYQKHEFYAHEYESWPNPDYWTVGCFLSCHVIGIGRHRIRLVMDYDVYCYYWDEDKPDYNRIVHYNNTADDYNDIWTFRFIGTPHIHPREKFGIARCFDVMRNGSFSGRLYIDGELIWNDEIYMER